MYTEGGLQTVNSRGAADRVRPRLLTGVSMQTTAWNWKPTFERQRQAAFDSSTKPHRIAQALMNNVSL